MNANQSKNQATAQAAKTNQTTDKATAVNEYDALNAVAEIAESIRIHRHLPASKRMTDLCDLLNDLDKATANLQAIRGE